MISIDGGQGEGGGQVLRTALSVAAALTRPFTLERVRYNRKPRGLKAQHLACVLACAELSRARLQGAKVGSERVVFEPTKRREPGNYRYDIGTAGATGLLLHAVAFPLWAARGRSEVVLTGGTHVEHAPSADDLELGWAPLLAAAGFSVAPAVVKTGFYPKGGGELRAVLDPPTPRRLDLRPGKPLRALVVARSASLPEHVAARLLERARERLEKRLEVPIEARSQSHGGPPGCAVTVAIELEGGGRLVARALGERGKLAERVADEAVDAVLADLHAGGAVDEHLADQLLLPLALGAGGSFVAPRSTDHLVTNKETLAQILPEARIEIVPPREGSAVLVSVEGSGAVG